MCHSGRLGYSPRTDLLQTPGVLQFVLDQVPQPWLDNQCACAFAAGVVTGTGMGEIGVIDTFVVWLEVAAQLPRHRRRRAPDAPGDLPDTVPTFAQGRNALAFQQPPTSDMT